MNIGEEKRVIVVEIITERDDEVQEEESPTLEYLTM